MIIIAFIKQTFVLMIISFIIKPFTSYSLIRIMTFVFILILIIRLSISAYYIYEMYRSGNLFLHLFGNTICNFNGVIREPNEHTIRVRDWVLSDFYRMGVTLYQETLNRALGPNLLEVTERCWDPRGARISIINFLTERNDFRNLENIKVNADRSNNNTFTLLHNYLVNQYPDLNRIRPRRI